MDKGVIMQEASPEVIYRDPNNMFTAQFIGTPPMNMLELGGDRVGFRPEKIDIAREGSGAVLRLKGKVLTREMLGSETLYKISLGGDAPNIMVKTDRDGFVYDDDVVLNVAAGGRGHDRYVSAQ